MEQGLALAGDGGGDGGVVVAERADADAGEQVEVRRVVFVEEFDALAAGEKDGVAVVGVEQEFGLGGLELGEVRHGLAPWVVWRLGEERVPFGDDREKGKGRGGRALLDYPTLAAMKLRRRWGTRRWWLGGIQGSLHCAGESASVEMTGIVREFMRP